MTQLKVMAILIFVILLFVGIGVLILIHVCIVWMAITRGFGNRNRDTIENGSFGSKSMSKDDIEKLPCFDFKAREKGSSSSPAGDCAVCLENFKVGDKCRLLPLCKHSFHAQCVDLWLLKTPICPICRASADSWKGGSVAGRVEGNSHFSGTGVELGETQTTDNASLSDEIAMELSDEDQTAGNENLVLN